MKKIIYLLSAFLFLTFTNPALAVQFKSGDSLTFDKATSIEETVFVSGNNINFDSKLNGDLICAGRNITITGDITGDIICAGQNIKVSGKVDGNIRVMGQSIYIEGLVSRNLSVLGQDLTLSSKSNVRGDIMFGGQSVDLSGVGGRDLVGAGNTVNISGSLLRNAVVTVSSINVASDANIGGSVDYFVEKEANTPQLMSGKNIKGDIRRHEIVAPEKPKMDQVEQKVKSAAPTINFIKTIFGILSFSLLACVLLYFTPQRTASVVSILEKKPVISGLIGLVILVVAPVALMIICSTVIGLPVALVLFLMYLITMFIATLYPSIWVGKYVMTKIKSKSKSLYLTAFVGCVVVGIVSMIPVIGWLMILVLFLVGLGASFLSYLPEK